MKFRLIFLIVFASILVAQDRPAFEVASIKECKPGDHPPSTSSPGRLSLGCWPLWRLISNAYANFATGKYDPMDFVPPPVEGPAWINSTSYRIDAKAETPASGAMMRGPMMQSLLKERFQLKLRREIREVPVYYMTVARDGLRVQPTKEGSCNMADPTDLARSYDSPLDGKAWCSLPRITRTEQSSVYDVPGVRLDVFFKLVNPRRPVIDRTGLGGLYDVRLEVENQNLDPPPDGAAADPPGASIVTIVRKQLGLELTPGKGPHEFLVVDRVERPSVN